MVGKECRVVRVLLFHFLIETTEWSRPFILSFLPEILKEGRQRKNLPICGQVLLRNGFDNRKNIIHSPVRWAWISVDSQHVLGKKDENVRDCVTCV